MLCVLFADAQNLVPNGSFEDYYACPQDYSATGPVKYVPFWDSPNNGTPDYFNACSHKCGVPLNWVGSAEAHHGNAYMGIIGCMQQIDPHQIAYREYIRVALADTLKKGVKYFASMQVRLGLSCTVGCNGLGMFFSATAMQSYQTFNYPVKAHVTGSVNKPIVEKGGWTEICGVFTAKGDERFLIIGNFLSNQQMSFENMDENLIATRHVSPMAYYYIDNVKVVPFADSAGYLCEAVEVRQAGAFQGKLIRDTRMVLNNLYFETGKAIIKAQSFGELDRLAYELKRNANLRITIFGHADNTGSAELNRKLSDDRAAEVRNYLLNKGVSKFRISTKGLGDTQPVAENISEHGKQLNRRVEIEVY